MAKSASLGAARDRLSFGYRLAGRAAASFSRKHVELLIQSSGTKRIADDLLRLSIHCEAEHRLFYGHFHLDRQSGLLPVSGGEQSCSGVMAFVFKRRSDDLTNRV